MVDPMRRGFKPFMKDEDPPKPVESPRPFSPPHPIEDPLGDVQPEGSDLDKKVPPKIMRLTQHLHNMIYIRFFYEQIGQQPPEWTKRELTRAERALIEELEFEEGQGGLLHGVKHATR